MSTLRTKEAKMTRVCSSIARPASPKSKANVTSQPLRMHEGGVIKRQPSSPAKSFKTVTKGMTKAECYAQLKNLLPNASHQENTSEVGCTIMLHSCNRNDPLTRLCVMLNANMYYLVCLFLSTACSSGRDDCLHCISREHSQRK